MSSEAREQSWLSFIPYALRNDRNVSDGAKVLYTFISSLCDKEGYCWAANKYLAEIVGISERELRRRIGELSKSRYIDIEFIKGEKGEILKRKIFLVLLNGGINVPTPRTDESSPYGQEWPYPMDRNGLEKITRIEDNKKRIYTPSYSPKGNSESEPPSSTPSKENGNGKDALFDEFWKAYPPCKRKANKPACKIAYLKIPNLKEEQPRILEGLRLWKEDKEWTRDDGRFIPAPLVFIHQQRWEGMYEEGKKMAEEEEKKKVTDVDISAFNEEFNL